MTGNTTHRTDVPGTPGGPVRHAASPPDLKARAGGDGSRRASPRFGRIARVITLWTLGWWAALGWIIHPVVPGGWWTLAAVAALELVIPLVLFRRAFEGRLYPTAAVRLLAFRPFWYLQLAVPLLATAGVLGALLGWPFGAAGPAGVGAVAGAGVLAAAVLLAGWVGSRMLVVRHVTATIPELPHELDGVRMAQLSDLHVGPHTSRRHLARAAEAVRDAEPDLVVFTGDQVDDYALDTTHFAAAFGHLHAPFGVWVVPGNHDVYAGWAAVRDRLEAAGFGVLVNSAVPVERDGAALWLAGTGDPAGRAFPDGAGGAAPDLDATLAEVPEDAVVVALAHNPALWPHLAERGVHLTLSGHTHHGQLSVPSLGWSLASVFLEHAMGAYQKDGRLLYINPGTNYWGLPFRLGALPEVTLIELRRGPAAGLDPA